MRKSDEELQRLIHEVLPELRHAVANQQYLDTADQAELYNLMSQMASVEARIDKLQHRQAAPPSRVEEKRGVVGVGKMLVLDFGDGEETYEFVEELPGVNGVSLESPVGRAIVGKRAGDTVTVTLPSGADVTVRVVSVRKK